MLYHSTIELEGMDYFPRPDACSSLLNDEKAVMLSVEMSNAFILIVIIQSHCALL